MSSDEVGGKQGMSPSLAGQHFGQRQPPLSVTIKAILERYPDGQIFKVCIVKRTKHNCSTTKTSEMIHHHRASLSKQQTADLLICHGTQQDLSLAVDCLRQAGGRKYVIA